MRYARRVDGPHQPKLLGVLPRWRVERACLGQSQQLALRIAARCGPIRRPRSPNAQAREFLEPFLLHFDAAYTPHELPFALSASWFAFRANTSGRRSAASFSTGHLHRVHLVPRGDRVHRLDTLQDRKTHPGFQIGTMLKSFPGQGDRCSDSALKCCPVQRSEPAQDG